MITRMLYSKSDFVVSYQQRSTLQKFAWPLWVMAIAFATIGVFWLPWRFPSTTPSMSESYSLGFNNRIAVVLLAAGIVAATFARLTSAKQCRAIEWFARRPNFLPPAKAGCKEYLVLLVLTFVWLQVIWAWGTYIVDPAYGDSRGMIYAIDLIALGLVPYRDFVFNYGAAHIYGPYWLSWTTAGAVSFDRAYLCFLALFFLVGSCSLFLFLRALRVRRASRPLTLGIVLCSWALFGASSAHVAARFMCVPVGLVLLHAALQRAYANTRQELLVASGAACGVVLYCLALSPEMGIAASLAVAVYACSLAALQHRMGRAIACMAGGALAITGTLLVFPNYFLTVVAFAGGFGNFPVYPNLQNAVIVTAAIVVFSSLIASALKHPDDPRSPLALGLAAGGGVLMVGCFGRAAPAHVFFNGTTPLLAMFSAVSRCHSFSRRSWTVIYVVVEIVFLQFSWWWTSYGTYNTALQLRRFYDANPAIVSKWSEQWDARRAAHPLGHKLHWGSVLPYPADLDELSRRGTIIQTGGSEWNLWLGRYLLLQQDRPNDFFTPWLLSACTTEQIQRRLQDLMAADYLIVPSGDFAGVEHPIDTVSYERFLRSWLTGLMTFPVQSEVRFAPFFPDTLQIKQLLSDYKPIGQFQFFMYMPFVVLEKKEGR